MINKICHLADIHIRKVPTRNDEYEKVFKTLIDSLIKEKPDRIVIVGDLVHDYLDLQGEQLILASDLLNELSKIAPVRVTRGNHDCRKKNLRRVDSVRAIVKTLHNPDVIYYGATGFYDDENIMWVVWHHGDQKNNP
jgi:DNA repair exonuclease SbcCD nuclease subunit